MSQPDLLDPAPRRAARCAPAELREHVRRHRGPGRRRLRRRGIGSRGGGRSWSRCRSRPPSPGAAILAPGRLPRGRLDHRPRRPQPTRRRPTPPRSSAAGSRAACTGRPTRVQRISDRRSQLRVREHPGRLRRDEAGGRDRPLARRLPVAAERRRRADARATRRSCSASRSSTSSGRSRGSPPSARSSARTSRSRTCRPRSTRPRGRSTACGRGSPTGRPSRRPTRRAAGGVAHGRRSRSSSARPGATRSAPRASRRCSLELTTQARRRRRSHQGHGPLHGLGVAFRWIGIGAVYVARARRAARPRSALSSGSPPAQSAGAARTSCSARARLLSSLIWAKTRNVGSPTGSSPNSGLTQPVSSEREA